MSKINYDRRLRKKRRISGNIRGDEKKPRVVVYRSSRYIYAQAIDDKKRVTLASCSSAKLRKESKKTAKKTEEARATGLELAAVLKEKKIICAVFDRSFYAYAGRVKALCDGLRQGGIKI